VVVLNRVDPARFRHVPEALVDPDAVPNDGDAIVRACTEAGRADLAAEFLADAAPVAAVHEKLAALARRQVEEAEITTLLKAAKRPEMAAKAVAESWTLERARQALLDDFMARVDDDKDPIVNAVPTVDTPASDGTGKIPVGLIHDAWATFNSLGKGRK